MTATAWADSFLDKYKDPDDGWIDLSSFLLDSNLSFLPVPIVITEPALGGGLGLAGAFFHRPPEGTTARDGKFLRPSISAVAALATTNDSWVVGGGHLGIWKDDTIRYTGGGGYASINLDFYGEAGEDSNRSDGLRFNAEGFGILQSIRFRLKDSDWFIGAQWNYYSAEIEFNTTPAVHGIEEDQLDFTNSGIGPTAEYDSRDSNFTPSTGSHVRLNALVYDEAIGGDFDYVGYETKFNHFWQLHERFVLGGRLDGTFIDGDAPFIAEPYIQLRGIPMMRYQGESVVTTEVEGRWDFHPRISLVAFVGAGRAASGFDDLGSAGTEATGGIGIRYFMAKVLGLRGGLDVARGPEETAVYLTIGQAWGQ